VTLQGFTQGQRTEHGNACTTLLGRLNILQKNKERLSRSKSGEIEKGARKEEKGAASTVKPGYADKKAEKRSENESVPSWKEC